jgi:HAD superfamily hydrolase (TIGR01493 family)
LFDFSGTLFHIEPAAVSLLRAIGPDAVALAAEVMRYGGINGAGRPNELPAELDDVWAQRDLSTDAHRAAYSSLSMRAGLDRAQADRLYDHGVSASAWHPYPDTIRVLRTLRANRVPVAVVSNIGWDPRPVLARYGVDVDIDLLVLSYERGIEKPDPRIFELACAELGVRPADAVMIGDNPDNDGGSRAIGTPFVEVRDEPATRGADELTRAVPGLAALLADPRPAA